MSSKILQAPKYNVEKNQNIQMTKKMNITIKLIMLAGLLSLIQSCATVSKEASKVTVHSRPGSILNDCKKLKPLSASSALGYDFAIAELREIAASKYQADTIAIVNKSDNGITATVQAIAFNCFK